MQLNKVLLFLLIVFFFACNATDEAQIIIADKEEETIEELPENPTTVSTNDSPNILLIIADDMGLDATPNFSIGGIKPTMPNLYKLMN
ncbi:hypothetical protein EHW67_07405 [Arenibacter aquaticus]|uniref:Sulfatase N-terminal domain-containing protein n=1 Tax=Arenibacter aquaticus TaxID=2489054 RepID=A0A3S0CNR8_9FLAO|nr:hypothetical protein [Arenibacter aquaticus]RTE53755.1 hypothetical protein EHW67_07405 [Arenibacter aquaticus]